jgi:hypothetical protein
MCNRLDDAYSREQPLLVSNSLFSMSMKAAFLEQKHRRDDQNLGLSIGARPWQRVPARLTKHQENPYLITLTPA